MENDATPEGTTTSKIVADEYKDKKIKFRREGQIVTAKIDGYIFDKWLVSWSTYDYEYEPESTTPIAPAHYYHNTLVNPSDVISIEDNDSLPVIDGPETYRPQSLGQRRRSKKKSKKSKRRKKTTRRRKRIRKSRH